MRSNKQYFFSKFTLNQLFSLGAHVGHLRRRLNKSMSVFLLGFRNGLVCIDLNFTIFFLRRAVNFLRVILKSRGSVFFFVSNWGPLQRYFRLKFFTRMHLWYSGPFLGGLLSNLRSVRYSYEARAFGNFFRTQILVPDTTILFDSTNFFYVYRDAFLLGIPSIGFVDTDLDYQNVLYPIILNNSGVKVNFLYGVFFLNILKQEHFLERFFLVKEMPSLGLQKKIFSKKFTCLSIFFLQKFLEKVSFNSYKFQKKMYGDVKSRINISLFVRRTLKSQLNKFKQLRRLGRSLMHVKPHMLKVDRFCFNVIGLLNLHKALTPGEVTTDRYKYDGRAILQRLRKTHTRFFFVKSRLFFLRRNFNKILRLRKLNFMKLRILLKLYRGYLTVTIFSRRSLFRRLLKKLTLAAQLTNKLRKMGSLIGVFNFLRFYFLKREYAYLHRLKYVSTRILTLLGSSRRKTSVMVSRLGDSFAFNQSVLSKDFYNKRSSRPIFRAKVIRKIKLKGGFLIIKRHLFKKRRSSLSKFPDGFDIKDAKRMRLRHARNIIEAKTKYYVSRRDLYEYNNLLNSRFKVEHSMFKNLSGLVKKGLFRRSRVNDHYALRHTKKPLVIYSEINPKAPTR